MRDLNQLNFVRAFRDRFRGPYLKIGTRYGLTKKMRDLFPNMAIRKPLRRFGIAPWLLKYRYLLPPVMINMVGIKR